MGDAELEQIRQRRIAEMQSRVPAGDNKGANNAEAKEEQLKAQQDMKNSILSQVLSQSARARLNTLRLGKPEKGEMVESMLVQMARSGRLRGQISEPEFIELLESVNKQFESQKVTVKFDRRRAAFDSDDDL